MNKSHSKQKQLRKNKNRKCLLSRNELVKVGSRIEKKSKIDFETITLQMQMNVKVVTTDAVIAATTFEEDIRVRADQAFYFWMTKGTAKV